MLRREDVKELLPILQAFAEGKQIQDKIEGLTDWIDTDGINLEYEGQAIKHRIKPEPKYRPFKTQEECWEEMLKHQPFGWVFNKSNDYLNIECVYSGYLENCYGVRLQQDKTNSSFENMFKNYKFADGTPFGIKED